MPICFCRQRLLAWPFLLFFLCFLASTRLPGQVIISEAVSHEIRVVDEDDTAQDWLELYNPGAAISLRGWSLTDDIDRPRRWQFGNVTLPARGYLLVFASGKDRPGNSPGPPHTNFKISNSGETLYLFSGDGAQVHSLVVKSVPIGASVGQLPGVSTPVLFDTPTPGTANVHPGFLGQTAGAVRFSRPGGYAAKPFLLTLSGNDDGGQTIRYTTDGTTPTNTSPVYTGPITVDTTMIVRASVTAPGQLPSPPGSATFLLDDRHELPVLCLAVDTALLFNPDHGIYVRGNDDYEPWAPYRGSNIWRDVEVPATMSYLPAGADTTNIKLPVGLKIFGGHSRHFAQRSLSLFARGKYGAGKIDYPIFPDLPYTEFASLVLRNSGNDWMRSMLRDRTMTGLLEGSGLDYTRAQPTAVYLNGEYWGFYNLREKVNEDWLASRRGLDPDEIDILEYDYTVVEGSADSYLDIVDYILENDLADPEHYTWVADRINIDNYIKYTLSQVYYGNHDWPANNLKLYRPQEAGAKWRWIIYDTDFGAGLLPETSTSAESLRRLVGNPTSDERLTDRESSLLLIRNLLRNRTFRERFVNQSADEMNTRFLPEPVTEQLWANAEEIRAEMNRARNRWGARADFPSEVSRIQSFFQDRPAVMKQHLTNVFQLSGHHRLTIEQADTSRGSVRLNSLALTDSVWSGDYFAGNPVRLTAVPRPGYRFSHWAGDVAVQDTSLLFDVTRASTVAPVFVEVGTATTAAGDLQSIYNVRYFPNPGPGPFHLAFATSHSTRVRAQLVTADGRLVRTFCDEILDAGVHRYSTEVSDLPAGIYYLALREGAGRGVLFAWVKR